MNAEQLAGKLHLQLVNDCARAQQRVVEMRALQKEFGDDALYTFDGRLVFEDSLTHSAQNLAHWIESALKDIAEYLTVIRELEAAFKTKNEQDIRDIVDYVRERHGDKPEPKRAEPIKSVDKK